MKGPIVRLAQQSRRKSAKTGKPVHALVLIKLDDIKPSPENKLLYNPRTDEEINKLAELIKVNGVTPLQISLDRYIISGHCRHAAARVAGLTEVPCVIDKLRRGDGEKASDEFLKALAAHNHQRIKTRDELFREAVVSVNEEEAYAALIGYRRRKQKIKVEPMELGDVKRRDRISSAKAGFLEAMKKIVFALKEFWPITVRHIHYHLLNLKPPPLIHAAKPGSRYRNNKESTNRLYDLATRARHEGHIPYEAIDDPSRRAVMWNVCKSLGEYYQKQVDDFLSDYWRDLLQSQPNYFEIVVEKVGLLDLVKTVAAKYTMTAGPGRGMQTTRPLYDVAQRYLKSGKERLVVIALADCDPDGDQIASSLGQRLRDDYHIAKVQVFKAALTMEQVKEHGLRETYERAKPGSPNYDRYIEKYSNDCVWELEALHPKVLQKLLQETIDAVIDRKLFNLEVAAEKRDAAHWAALKQRAREVLLEIMPALPT
jgi:ParB-like nuclease family protein